MDQQAQIPNAPFPAPPPFWKHFTSENLSRLQTHKEEDTASDKIPPDLTYLEPPIPPAGTYTAFGEEQTLSNELPTLSSRGVTQLYPSESNIDHPHYLLQIIRSLHLNFQELVLILSQNPSLKDQKLEDIKNLFQNANWLVNLYRPHQARETLIAMMEDQIRNGKQEMEECDRLQGKVDSALKTFEQNARDIRKSDEAVANTAASTIIREAKSRQLWKMMMDIHVEDE